MGAIIDFCVSHGKGEWKINNVFLHIGVKINKKESSQKYDEIVPFQKYDEMAIPFQKYDEIVTKVWWNS